MIYKFILACSVTSLLSPTKPALINMNAPITLASGLLDAHKHDLRSIVSCTPAALYFLAMRNVITPTNLLHNCRLLFGALSYTFVRQSRATRLEFVQRCAQLIMVYVARKISQAKSCYTYMLPHAMSLIRAMAIS
jgi:hypothetical protein